MTKKSNVPKTTMKVPIYIRELVRQMAKDSNTTMMNCLIETIEGRRANLRQNDSEPSTALLNPIGAK